MRTLFVLSMLIGGNCFANDVLSELQKKHQALREKERKKWSVMEYECKSKFSHIHDHTHPDYDAHFDCLEKIADLEYAFEVGLEVEMCQKAGVCK